MTNSRANTTTMEKLDDHLATGTEASYTYTPGTALDMKGKYAYILVLMTGKATAALRLDMKVNGGTDYNTEYTTSDAGTIVHNLGDAVATAYLLSQILLDGANTFAGEAKIILNDAGDFMSIISHYGAFHEGSHVATTEMVTAATTITSIETKTSTSTWIAGTRIITYGILST